MHVRRTLPALGAFFVAIALVVSGCGGDSVPGNAVARVDDATISQATFNHWMNIAARQSQPPGAGGAVVVPDPPNFTKCIANKRKNAPKPAKGQPRQTDAQLKRQCEQEYNTLRDQVLQFLISAEWIEGEAADMGIKVTDKQVLAQFNKLKKQSFPKESEFQEFLKTSGQTREDLLFQVRRDELTNKIREKITKAESKVTNAEIAEYYEKNKRRFAQPERRDVQIILTKTKAQADRAKAEIEGGETFSAVARSSSIDEASKTQGGRLLGVTKGQQEKALDDAIFKARRGQLEGPIKTQFGYYVFRVNKITPPSQQTLAQSRQTIRQLLISQNQQKALDAFVKEFQEKWKDRTNCRKGFVVQNCKNAPKPKTTATAPAGAQQAPQGGTEQAPTQP